ncbi:ABC transporter permease [Aeoliella mucimassa]|uniref:Lipoprotein-releasing system transmembrane protein LolC n=1 Tax=Aeoliella mucimassa TaxID=2527972 RepID=A0A518ASN2_9BACT|nr:FtsX-like permease family protein [Aeoliella mucimassa]QDU57725.1 Lipoprotein-releasing system transmembrane protein LolC [Aeoliella mucimassa]
MYKLLLCWRYLKTRYIALACIVSVTLGVATMIVVNSVMGGVSRETKERMNDVLGDITIRGRSLEGIPNYEWHHQEIMRLLGDDVVAMTPVAHVPAMLGYYTSGQYMTQQVQVMGIDPESYNQVCAYTEFLQHPENREHPDFELKDSGYDTVDHSASNPAKAQSREVMATAGWLHRRQVAEFNKRLEVSPESTHLQDTDDNPHNPFAAESAPVAEDFNPATDQHTGTVVQLGFCTHETGAGGIGFHLLPGDDIEITFPSAGRPPKPLVSKLTVTDLYDSKIQMVDGNIIFMPLDKLQEMRGMIDPQSGVRFVNAIQLKLKPGVDQNTARDLLREHFQPHLYSVYTWRDLQGPMLTAITVEIVILNLLLFLIIAVAGFGILAIFFMIVVEKTRDIGILKSLGASSSGVMGIFLTYGFSLGLVGAGCGVLLGLIIAYNVQEIAEAFAVFAGIDLYDSSIYPTLEIPTLVEPFTVSWIALGAMGIAVLASVFPALRAAKMHPVEALRFE